MWYVIGIRRNGERIILQEARTEYKALQASQHYTGLEQYQSITIEEDRPVKETNGRSTLRLGEAAARTPAIPAAQAMKQQLQLALFDAVTPEDVRQMALKLKELALSGNLAAMRLFFDMALPRDAAKVQQAVFVNNGERALPTSKSRVVEDSEED